MGDVTHYVGDQCPGGHYEETIVPEPMTDDDLAAIERLLMYDVIGTDPADASGATTDDVAEVAGDLLAEAKRLQDIIRSKEEEWDREYDTWRSV